MDVTVRNYSTTLRIIAILLGGVLVANLFSIVTTFQQNAVARDRAVSYEARVQEAQALVDRQRNIILDLVTDYESAAYADPGIDRIAEQQLLAAEHQLVALQILAIQNGQIIELLSATP